MEKWILTVTWHGIAVRKTTLLSLPVVQADRLKLVPAIDHHSCCILNLQEMQCSLHDILLPWQRDIIRTEYPNPVDLTMPILQPSNCLPWWVNKIKISLKYVLFILSFLPMCRKKPLFHSTREYYIYILYTEKMTAYQISMGHPYQKNMEKFFNLHV